MECRSGVVTDGDVSMSSLTVTRVDAAHSRTSRGLPHRAVTIVRSGGLHLVGAMQAVRGGLDRRVPGASPRALAVLHVAGGAARQSSMTRDLVAGRDAVAVGEQREAVAPRAVAASALLSCARTLGAT